MIMRRGGPWGLPPFVVGGRSEGENTSSAIEVSVGEVELRDTSKTELRHGTNVCFSICGDPCTGENGFFPVTAALRPVLRELFRRSIVGASTTVTSDDVSWILARCCSRTPLRLNLEHNRLHIPDSTVMGNEPFGTVHALERVCSRGMLLFHMPTAHRSVGKRHGTSRVVTSKGALASA